MSSANSSCQEYGALTIICTVEEWYCDHTQDAVHVQMQALMAEAQASAAKAAAEREKEAAQRALKAKNLPMMLRGAKLNITAQAPVKGNALQEAAAKAPPPQTSTPKAGDSANGLARSGERVIALDKH